MKNEEYVLRMYVKYLEDIIIKCSNVSDRDILYTRFVVDNLDKMENLTEEIKKVRKLNNELNMSDYKILLGSFKYFLQFQKIPLSYLQKSDNKKIVDTVDKVFERNKELIAKLEKILQGS